MSYPNPFNSELALEHSSYCAFQQGYLVNLIEPQKTASQLAEFVHGQFYALTMDARFSCVAARSAFKQKTYRFAMYPEINSAAATAGLCRDLFAFVQEQPEVGGPFTTFVASFAGPNPIDEEHFEKLLWQQLQSLHEQDTVPWDSQVSSDPESGRFSFSFAGRAFFIVGLHAGSSRWVRRFAWPTLVFNSHDQFEHLRKIGKYAHFQRTIRSLEHSLQGSINPSLSNFSEMSEAAQYSGRVVEESWKCPFTAREKSESCRVTQLVVDEDAFELGIVSPAACVIEGVKVLAGSGELDEEIDMLEQELSRTVENILVRSEVKAFNELFERMGYPRQQPAGQRLVETLLRNGFKRHNNIVDACNIASTLFGSGLGLHDVTRSEAQNTTLQVRRAQGNEKIIPRYKKERVGINAGDLIYGLALSSELNPLTCLGKRDVDSDESRVSDDTTAVLVVALGNAATAEAYNRMACLKTFELIRRTCPHARISFLNRVVGRDAGSAQTESTLS